MVTDPLYPWKRAISEELRKHVSMVTGPLYPWKSAISQEIKKYVSLVTGPHYSCQLRMREVISWMKPLWVKKTHITIFLFYFLSWHFMEKYTRCMRGAEPCPEDFYQILKTNKKCYLITDFDTTVRCKRILPSGFWSPGCNQFFLWNSGFQPSTCTDEYMQDRSVFKKKIMITYL